MENDLISRQAAIDAINEYFSRIAKLKRKGLTEGEKAISLDVVGAIKSLSSVQREQSIVEWQKDFREYINMLNIPRDDYNGIMEYIDELPFAQSEIIQCKDCKHRPKRIGNECNGFDFEFPDGMCPCQCEDGWYNWMPKDNWFCANGEREEE